METKDVENICWICRRTKEELNKPFEDEPDFKIPLREVDHMINYSGFYICDVCESMFATVGATPQKVVDGMVDERIRKLFEKLLKFFDA